MRVSQHEKAKTHQRIVKGAARLLRERGIATTSVADVMGHAGHTNGGFYRHFADKDALVEEALAAAFDERITALESDLETAGPVAALAKYRDVYLSPGHVKNPGVGCPMPALAAEVGRATPAIKSAFGSGVQRTVDALANLKAGADSGPRTEAMRELAMMVGALVLARASDAGTAAAVLAACRAATAGTPIRK